MKMIRCLFVAGALAIISGCSTMSMDVSDEAPVDLESKSSAYKIGVSDVLSVNVWRNPELSLTIPVRPDGNISLPLAGDIKAAGVSASELGEDITARLSNFIRNPQVTVIVLESLSSDYQQRVRVTGAVENPISVAYRDGMTVLDLVLEAGGVNDFALGNRAVLYRTTGAGVKAYRIKLNDIFRKGQLDTNFALHPSDIITVPERSF